MKFTIRCTRCRKTSVMDEDELKKSSQLGCAFSRCCNAVATVECVENNGRPIKNNRRFVKFSR